MILSLFVLLYDCQLTICQLTDSKPRFFDDLTILCTVLLIYVLVV